MYLLFYLQQGSNSATDTNDTKDMNDEELEEFYRNGGVRSDNGQLERHASTASASSSTSAHSQASSSGAQLSRQSSSSSKRVSKTVDTQEMGIQTTIGKSSSGIGPPLYQIEDEKTKPKERKSSTKDKMKKLFRRKSSTGSSEIEVRIEEQPPMPELPQGFVVKYMGKRPTKGMYGSKHTRVAVEEVIDAISKMPKTEDLPLVNLDVYYQGLGMRPHSKNKIKSFKAVQIPIQYISYGIQDTVYPRIFCFIMIKEMSSQEKTMECHVYACDVSKNARAISACLAAAFHEYTKFLKGGAIKFAVDVKMDADADKISNEV